MTAHVISELYYKHVYMNVHDGSSYSKTITARGRVATLVFLSIGRCEKETCEITIMCQLLFDYHFFFFNFFFLFSLKAQILE